MTRIMKDSGIEWIGQIPQDWDINKIKNYCKNVFSGGTPDTTKPEYWEGEISWLPSGELQNCTITQPVRFITNEGLANSSTKMIPANTTLIAMTGATCGNIGYLTFDSCANQSVTAYIAKDKTYSKFLYYLLQSAREEILLNKTGGAQGGINVSNCKNISVPFVSYVVQQVIANYLDDKCGKINSAIENQKKIIEKLKEYKQSLITETVTKGLDPNVPMKDSGIEWIGNIPQNWEIGRIKYNYYLKGRIGWQGLKASEFIDEGAYLITGTDFCNGRVNWSTCYHISEERYNEAPEIHVKTDDLLITKDGTVGKIAYIDDKPEKVSLNSHLLIIRPYKKEYQNKFLYWVIQSDVFKKYYQLSQNGTIMASLSKEKVSNFSFALPKINEQIEIAKYLDKKCSEIDKAIADKEKLIEKFTEYKKSLIYECVTGKKEIV